MSNYDIHTNYPYPPAAPPRESHHGLAISSFVLGIVAVVFGLVPLTFLFALGLAALGLVFGLIGRKHGLGKAGVVLSIIAIALGIWGAVIVNQAAHQFDKDIDCINNSQTSEQLDKCN